MFAFSTGTVEDFRKFAKDHERPLVGVLDSASENKAYKDVKVRLDAERNKGLRSQKEKIFEPSMKAALVKGAIALQKEIVRFIDDDTKKNFM